MKKESMKHDHYGILQLYHNLIGIKNIDESFDNNGAYYEDHSECDEESSSKKTSLENWRKRKKKIIMASTLLSFVLLWWRRRLKRPLAATSQVQRHLGSPASKFENYRNAVETPLSLLLVAAKKGLILKAMINNNLIAYQLRDSAKQENEVSNVTWKKSLLPKENSDLLKEIMNDLAEGGCLDISVLPESFLSRMGPVFVAAFPFIYLFILYHMLKRLQHGQSNIDNGGVDYQSRGLASTTTFADVAGIDTAQIELQEVVSYLSNPEPFLGLGASPPRGLLLHGKPGLGKTLLARAVAGEAKADYFMSCTGSDFVEIYVGQGAKRVRQLFSEMRVQALNNWRKQNCSGLQYYFNKIIRHENLSQYERSRQTKQPTAVLFIDETDSLAKCRDGIGRGAMYGGSGGNDEREQTLNALLSEMDGFNKSEVVIIVIAATNRLSILDPALIRPGRFDRHVALTAPNANGREAILKVHARHKKLDHDVNLREIADDRWTATFTGAELRNVINEAALLAVRQGCQSIRQYHIHQSIEKIKMMRGKYY